MADLIRHIVMPPAACGVRSLSEYSPRPETNLLSVEAEPTKLGMIPMRRRQRRMKANPSAPEGLALEGASALQSQRGSRGILGQAPSIRNPIKVAEGSAHD